MKAKKTVKEITEYHLILNKTESDWLRELLYTKESCSRDLKSSHNREMRRIFLEALNYKGEQ